MKNDNMNQLTKTVCEEGNDPIMVTIRCITYNHEPYIRQCLEGFVMQKTNFRFEAIVHDDASTDGTAAIIREYAEKYPDIIKPIYETENQFSKHDGSLGRIMDAHMHGKYIAMCEGDDYWIDPLKLQKQVDFLEANPEYGMCYTNFNIYYQQTGRTRYSLFTTEPDHFPMYYRSPEEFVLAGGYVCPPSWLIRKEYWLQMKSQYIDGTFVRFTYLLCVTKVHAMSDVTAVYRILKESATQSKNSKKLYRRRKDLLKLKLILIREFNLSPTYIDKCKYDFYKKTLPAIVLYNDQECVKEARKVLTLRTIRDRILFFCNAIHCNKILYICKFFRTIYRNLLRK